MTSSGEAYRATDSAVTGTGRPRVNRDRLKASSFGIMKSIFSPEAGWMMLNSVWAIAAPRAASGLASKSGSGNARASSAACSGVARMAMSTSLVKRGSP